MRGVLDVPESLLPVATLVERALERVRVRFDRQLACDLPAVSDLVGHVERYRGKMLRPMLAVLSGVAVDCDASSALVERGADAVELSDDLITVAAVCEMVHMATLVHDDVLDEADVRRRGETVNRMRGNEAAVILGDYLIAGAYHLCSQIDDQTVALEIGRVCMSLCAGELLQIDNRDQYSIDEPTYFEIIERKTGELIGAACGLGAAVGGADDASADALRRFGVKIGLAFQIQDDLLDLLGREGAVGKSTGKDLQKGKLTLPVIHHLGRAQPVARGKTLILLEAAGETIDADHTLGDKLVEALNSTGSITAARTQAVRLVDEAKSEIGALVGPCADMLGLMADAVVDRSY